MNPYASPTPDRPPTLGLMPWVVAGVLLSLAIVAGLVALGMFFDSWQPPA